MDLMHNQAFRLAAGPLQGIYRVVLDEPAIDTVVVVRLDSDTKDAALKGGRRKLEQTRRKRKKPLPPNVGALLWLSRSELRHLDDDHHLIGIEIELDSVSVLPVGSAEEKIYESRKAVMRGFLNFDHFRESVLVHRSISGLVQEAVISTGTSSSRVYKLWSIICRSGFSESSLRPSRDKCGAPGVPRPCDPEGREKAGRKTAKQATAAKLEIRLPPEQPGMSTAWRLRIMAADSAIPTPKPSFTARYTQIINSHFVNRFKRVEGKLVPVNPEKAREVTALARYKKKGGEVLASDPEEGTYPNRAQVRRVLEVEIPRLLRVAQRTTAGHFKRSLRGLLARNWKGVSGPGHTWAIDSTIGDIYLRSSLNVAWIIGRPVVYVMCDVWSTAIVGFYVCLQGPSWDMAKLAIFSAGACPSLIGALWGYEPLKTLFPTPTLPCILLCDNGEYKSVAASQTGMTIEIQLSYAPPYRPDLKGLVEVMHRIMKDTQRCDFVPGAIDARRAEMELRKFNPNDGIFTVRQYVQCERPGVPS